MVVFDATILLILFSPDVAPPRDPATNNPVDGARERIDFLVQQLEKNRTKIIVPTPALSEILVRAGTAGSGYLSQITGSAAFRIADFDTRAAIEVAAMTRAAIDGGDKRGEAEGHWSKIKYDRQIVAIAKTEGASIIYSDDNNVHTLGGNLGLSVLRIADLPLPPVNPQTSLDLDETETDDNE